MARRIIWPENCSSLAGTKIAHVPWGAGPALTDLMGGQIDAMFDGMGSSAGHIKGGRIKAIAVASDNARPASPISPQRLNRGSTTRCQLVSACGRRKARHRT